MHPLANDQSAPEIIRKAFSRVTHAVVMKLADGTVSEINCIGAAKAESVAAEKRAILARGGGRYRSLVGPTYETKLISVEIREV